MVQAHGKAGSHLVTHQVGSLYHPAVAEIQQSLSVSLRKVFMLSPCVVCIHAHESLCACDYKFFKN